MEGHPAAGVMERQPRLRRRAWTLGRVLGGFSVGLLGAVVWITASFLGGFKAGFGEPDDVEDIFVRAGFLLMVLGP